MKKIIASLGCLLLTLSAWASHNRAAEITYLQIDEYSIECKLVTYTDAPLIAASRDSLQLSWGDGSTTWLYRVNGPDADNNSFPDGELLENNYQQNIYLGQHRYAEFGDYVLSFSELNRQGDIINLNPPNSIIVPIYVETAFTLGPEINHSPQLLQAPIDIAFANIPFVHTPAAYDPDGDSLSYAIITPLMASGEIVPNYTAPNLVVSNPPGILDIEQNTGIITWDAPVFIGTYTWALEITSYRNGQAIGRIIRDMIIIVREDDNAPPSIEIVPPDFSVQEVAVGDTVRLVLSTFDENVGQTVVMNSLSGLYDFFPTSPDFVYTPLMDQAGEASFYWLVSQEQVRQQPYLVVFRSRDNLGLATYRVLSYRVKGIISNREEVEEEKALALFPNPAGERLWLAQAKVGQYTIWNSLGQAVLRGKLEQEQQLSTQVLAHGLYYFQLEGYRPVAFYKSKR